MSSPGLEHVQEPYAGLQYSDTAYVSIILFVLLPVTFASIFAIFAGNAKHLRYFFSAAHASVACFCYVVAWVCNLDTDAVIGVPISILVVSVAGAISMFYTELFAFTVNTMFCFLIITAAFLQMLASLTPLNLGILSLIPGFATWPPLEQFAWQMTLFTILSVTSFLCLEKLYPETRETIGWMNWQSAFISSYFFIGGCSYLFVLIGLSNASALDPIGLFSLPSEFSFHTPSHLILVTVWVLLTVSGWSVQTKREKYLRSYGSGRPLIEEMQGCGPSSIENAVVTF